MAKEALKQRINHRQNGRCALSLKELPKETRLYDTDRKRPKVKGGIYTDENTRVVDPVAHMKRHGIYRERTPEMTELKILMDAREHIRKLLNSLDNRMSAAERNTDEMDPMTEEWILNQRKEIDRQLGKQDRRVAKYLKSLDLPIVNSALQVKGLGPVSIAYLLIYIDISKARYASSLWSYVGLDKPSYERYTKGVSGGGNKILRTALYALAGSMIRTKCIYSEVYYAEKLKLENSNKVTKSRNTEGFMIECPWSETKPSHRHGAAIRKMIKHFLADFWYVWRTLEGLDTPMLYPEAKLGHTGIVKPEERGWIY